MFSLVYKPSRLQRFKEKLLLSSTDDPVEFVITDIKWITSETSKWIKDWKFQATDLYNEFRCVNRMSLCMLIIIIIKIA